MTDPMPTERTNMRHAFVSQAGWGGAASQPLKGDASSRRYWRLIRPDHVSSAILMDAPPEQRHDVKDFARIARHLSALGLSPPRILAKNSAQGFMLLEDLGENLYSQLLAADPTREAELYRAAIVVLAELHRAPLPSWAEPMTVKHAADLALLCWEWFAPEPTPTARAHAHRLISDALSRHDHWPRVLTLRDFHADNLFWLPARSGSARVGLIDFQDAAAWHPAYDLVSLLADVRRDVSPHTARTLEREFAHLGGHDPDELAAAAAAHSAQRQLRILGVFARLAQRDGKPAYLALMPKVWARLEDALSHPDLADLAQLVHETVPEPHTPAEDPR